MSTIPHRPFHYVTALASVSISLWDISKTQNFTCGAQVLTAGPGAPIGPWTPAGPEGP